MQGVDGPLDSSQLVRWERLLSPASTPSDPTLHKTCYLILLLCGLVFVSHPATAAAAAADDDRMARTAKMARMVQTAGLDPRVGTHI